MILITEIWSHLLILKQMCNQEELEHYIPQEMKLQFWKVHLDFYRMKLFWTKRSPYCFQEAGVCLLTILLYIE